MSEDASTAPAASDAGVLVPDAETSVTVSHLTVSFDGFKAVDDVDLLMLKGQVHFLIGPNGAGKTTLVDALLSGTDMAGTDIGKDDRLMDGQDQEKERGITILAKNAAVTSACACRRRQKFGFAF